MFLGMGARCQQVSVKYYETWWAKVRIISYLLEYSF